jgi:hypothetical protein
MTDAIARRLPEDADMNRRLVILGLMGRLIGMAGGFGLARSAHADSVSVGVSTDSFHLGIQIGSPPPLVVVPGTAVYHAPSVPHNYFLYGGRYYVLHEGIWYYSAGYNGPWVAIAIHQVPQPIVVVPVKYYKVPPGHINKRHHHYHKDHKKKRDDD